MPLSFICRAAVPLLIAWTAAAQESPLGDLSQIGDVGPAPTDLSQLVALDLDDEESAEAFERALQLILEEYQGVPVTESELYLGALVGMVDLLNRKEGGPTTAEPSAVPRNAVMSPAQTTYVDQMKSGCKTGIGIEFQANTSEGVLYVTSVVPASPASRNALRPGDLIIGIDGQPLQRRSLPEILDMLRGDEGTPIGLTVVRGSVSAAPFGLVLTREVYTLPTVDASLLDDGVALVRISGFHGKTGAEARARLDELDATNVKAIVLDLRSNQGGLLGAVLDVAALFLEEGTVVARLQDAIGRERDLVAAGPLAYSGPMICLVNRWTSSGAEVLAATLQESGRAVLVGETTAGNGVTESLHPLATGVSLRLSSTTLLSPLGTSWHGVGLTPDYHVQGIAVGVSEDESWQTVDVQITFARQLLGESQAAP